VLQQRLWNK